MMNIAKYVKKLPKFSDNTNRPGKVYSDSEIDNLSEELNKVMTAAKAAYIPIGVLVKRAGDKLDLKRISYKQKSDIYV